jgi:hypothetical protein
MPPNDHELDAQITLEQEKNKRRLNHDVSYDDINLSVLLVASAGVPLDMLPLGLSVHPSFLIMLLKNSMILLNTFPSKRDPLCLRQERRKKELLSRSKTTA